MFQNVFAKPIDEKDEKENMDGVDVNYNGKDYIKIEAEYGYWLLFFWCRKKIISFRSIKKNEILNVTA